MKQKLYELTKEMVEFEEYCEDNEDIDPQTKLDTLNSIALNFDKKATGVALMVKNISTPIKTIDAEIKRLQAHKRAIESDISFFKDYLKGNMVAVKKDVIENDIIKIRLQEGPAKLEITCEVDQLPKKYFRTKIDIVVETELIKTVLKAGKKIPGCKLTKDKFVKFY